MDLPNAPFYRRWSFILASVIGLAMITALVGWRGLQQANSPATTALPSTTVTGPPPTTAPPSSEPTSKTQPFLWSADGSDSVRSLEFRAPDGWRIEWSFDCGNFKRYGGGNFKITGDGAFDEVVVQKFAVRDSGTRRFRHGGYGHLQVASVCRRWSVRVLPG